MKNMRAFTLIELSIVLVVIGLIAGGILVGKDLIEGAKIRSQMAQIEEFTTATNTFHLKYNCLPGDCLNAVALGLGTQAYHNGDGDKIIGPRCMNRSINYTSGQAHTGENHNFFMHLSEAGLMDGDYEGFGGEPNNTQIDIAMIAARFPKSKLDQVYVFPNSFALGLYDGVTPRCGTLPNQSHVRSGGNGFGLSAYGITGTTHFKAAIDKQVGYNLDLKMDDGIQHTGNVGVGIDNANWDDVIEAVAATNGCRGTSYMTNNCTGGVEMVFLNRF